MNIKKKSINWENYISDQLKKHPEEIVDYLNTSLEEYEKDGNLEAFLMTLRMVTKVKKGMSQLAKETGSGRQSLYVALSKKGNPTIKTVDSILHSLGMRLRIEAIS